MESLNGVISRSIPYFSVAGADNHHHRASNLSFRSGFSDQGHVSYYHAPPRCGGKKEKEKGVICTSTKKKMKLLKGLRKDLSMFSEFGFSVDPNSVLVGEDQGKIVSEAADALLKQFQQLRAEEKELKKKKKLEKAQLKAARMRTMPESSSSSESSESECGEVIQMSRLKKKTLAHTIVHESQTCIVEENPNDIATGPQECNPVSFESSLENQSMVNLSTSSSNALCDSLGARKLTNKIEVCMGAKCKKSGGAQLMEEFERVMGVEGSVVGCKCMGKCRDGPNVRVLTPTMSTDDDSVRTPAKSMCVGVGLADVGVILANLLGEDKGFTPATA